MKAIVERDHLKSAMSRIAGIVESKNVVAILSNVLIESEPGLVRFRSTNLDMEAIESISCDMLNETGATTVSAKTLSDIANNAPEGAQIKLDLGDRLTVSFGRSRFQLAKLDPSSFPSLMAGEFPGSFEIEPSVLQDMLARTVWSAAKDVSMSAYQGVHLEWRDEKLFAVATNMRTMAIVTCPAPEGSSEIRLTIPTKAVAEIISLLGGKTDKVTIRYSESKVSVQSGSTIITSKILDGAFAKFPIVESRPMIVKTDRDGLIQMIKRTRITTDKSDAIKLTFSDGGVSASTRSDGGFDTGLDEMAAEYEGDDFSVGFSGAQILGVLDNLKGDVVEFQFPPELKTALVIKAPVDPDTLMNSGTIRV